MATKEGDIHQAFVANPLKSVQTGEDLNLTLTVWDGGYNVQEKVAGVPIGESFQHESLDDHSVSTTRNLQKARTVQRSLLSGARIWTPYFSTRRAPVSTI